MCEVGILKMDKGHFLFLQTPMLGPINGVITIVYSIE